MVSTDNKQFQYEVQDYQENCVQNIVSIFERLYWKEKYRYNDGNRNGKNLYFH